MIKKTLADWLKSSIVPSKNQVCFCVDTQEIRYGDGINTWTKLPNYPLLTEGPQGPAGDSVIITNISESDVDSGSNIITFSTGETITIKNGSQGSKGDKGETGAAGAETGSASR